MAMESSSTVVAPPSTWAPLRTVVFRALWLAVLGSQIGTWMQTVGAQWLLVDEPNAATLVSLVQTAMMLPILLLALPAGVLADSFDRRRMLVAVQCFQAAVGAVLTVLTVDYIRVYSHSSAPPTTASHPTAPAATVTHATMPRLPDPKIAVSGTKVASRKTFVPPTAIFHRRRVRGPPSCSIERLTVHGLR